MPFPPRRKPAPATNVKPASEPDSTAPKVGRRKPTGKPVDKADVPMFGKPTC